MRNLISLIALTLFAAPALAATAMSMEYGEPGFYGRLVLGDAPRPVLIYREPVVVVPVERAGPPIYMRVPPGHSMHWDKHCASYGACSHPVYFVQDGWYNDVYVPHYRKGHPGKGKGHGKGHNK